MRRQTGGTFIGFIVGVVVGLGAALAVAVYVTKVPVPFANRASGNSAEKDAADDRKNKDWDPNAPLYGKTPAKPAATASAAASAPTAPGLGTSNGGLVAPAVIGRNPAAPSAKPGTSADPLGDLANARSAAPSADPFAYFVQAGAFRSTDDAEAQRAKLSLMGVQAKVSEREQSGRTVFRVRVGPFDRKDDAEKLKGQLDGSGVESALVRVQR